MKMNRYIRMTTVTVLLLLLNAGLALSVFADSVTDTISVYVGYFGWEDDEYVEKATYHWSELDDNFGGALDTKVVVYSYYNGSRTYLAAARGFTVRDLLEHGGIDLSSISKLDFFTKDQTVGAYRSFTKYSLLDMPRYYFSNLAANEETGELYPWNGNNIRDGATRVESMLALEDYTEWDAVGKEFEKYYDRTMFSPNSRFHLFFGQADPKEANTSSAAKYVYKILVTFSGTPVFSLDQSNIDMKVGSGFRVNVNVAAEDALLDQYVAQHIQWSSSDESVAEVDAEGRLSAKKTGAAVITATFGNTSMSVTVKVSGSGSEGGGENPGNQSMPAGITAPEGVTEQQPVQEINRGASAMKKEVVYELSSSLMSRKEYAQWVQRVLKNIAAPDKHVSKQSQTSNIGMSRDAEQLVLLAKEKLKLFPVLGGTFVTVFAIGFMFGLVRFKLGISN